MDALYNLKDKLCKELKEYGDKELSAGSLSTIDSLAHTIKNLDKIIEKYDGQSYGDGRNYMMGRYSDMNNGMSFAGRGAGAKRDSMGRYSRGNYSLDDDFRSELKDLMHNAPNEHIKQKLSMVLSEM